MRDDSAIEQGFMTICSIIDVKDIIKIWRKRLFWSCDSLRQAACQYVLRCGIVLSTRISESGLVWVLVSRAKCVSRSLTEWYKVSAMFGFCCARQRFNLGSLLISSCLLELCYLPLTVRPMALSPVTALVTTIFQSMTFIHYSPKLSRYGFTSSGLFF